MKQTQFVIMFDMEYSHENLLIFSVENNFSCSAIGIVHYVWVFGIIIANEWLLGTN